MIYRGFIKRDIPIEFDVSLVLKDNSIQKDRESLEEFSIGVAFSKQLSSFLTLGAASTLSAGRPVLPGVATPAPDFLGTCKVGINRAWSSAPAAGRPVAAIYLP